MRGWVRLAGLLAGVLAVGMSAWAQGAATTTLVEPPTPLLATTDSLVAAGGEFTVPEDSAEVQAILKEDGLARMESRVTLVPTASKRVASGWVKAYQFGDATGAFSAYTYFRMGGRPSVRTR